MVEPGTGPVTAGRATTLVVVLAVVAPLFVLVGVLAGRTWTPTGDQAQAELRMLSLPEDPPLVGAAGRIEDDDGRQGNHPGPLMFWVAWPVDALLGGSSWAYEAATAAVFAAWTVGALLLVRRRGPPPVLVGSAAAVLLLMVGYGLEALTQPWNPWSSLAPYLVLVVAAWSALDGDRWMLPLAVAAGSFAVQGHVGYLPVVPPLVLVALVGEVRAAQAGTSGTGPGVGADGARAGPADSWVARLIPVVGGSLLLGLVLWSGPIVDAWTNDPSNVDKLRAHFLSPDEDPLGLVSGARTMLQVIDPTGPLVDGAPNVGGSWLPGAMLLVVWAGVALSVAVRRLAPTLSRLDLVLAVGMVTSLVAVSRVFGAVYLYTFRWIVVLVALQLVSVVWGVTVLVGSRSERRPSRPARRVAGRDPFALLGASTLAVLSIVVAVTASTDPLPYARSGETVAALSPDLTGSLDPDATYLVRWDDPVYLGGIGFGVLLELERRGFDVGADPRHSAAVEPHRVLCPGEADAVLVVATGEQVVTEWRDRDDARLLAEADPRTERERREADADRERLVELLIADGMDVTEATLDRALTTVLLTEDPGPEVAELAGRIVDQGLPSAVFETPADDSPLADLPVNEVCGSDP